MLRKYFEFYTIKSFEILFLMEMTYMVNYVANGEVSNSKRIDRNNRPYMANSALNTEKGDENQVKIDEINCLLMNYNKEKMGRLKVYIQGFFNSLNITKRKMTLANALKVIDSELQKKDNTITVKINTSNRSLEDDTIFEVV